MNAGPTHSERSDMGLPVCDTDGVSTPRTPETPAEMVERRLRERLATMQSNEPLPSVRQLAADFGVSSPTVQKALTRLRADGLITSRPGWGVFKA